MIFLNNSKRSIKHLGYGNRATLQRGQLGSRISDKSKNNLSQKITSVFLATVLLGSIATFPPYVEDNTLDALEQNNLQNPEIKKIIELFSGFMPTLQEAEAAPNENALKSKNFRLLGLSGQLSSATLELDLVKGELAVLAHNPSSNSKKVQEIQAKLAGPMENMIVIAQEMGNEIDELTELIEAQTQIDQATVDSLNTDLDGLEDDTTANEQAAIDLESSVTNFVDDVEEKKEALKDEGEEVDLFATAVLSTFSDSPSESIVDDPDFQNMLDALDDFDDASDDLEELDEMQDDLIEDANSLESQINETQIQSTQISMGISEVTESESILDDSITIAHNAVLQQQNALNSLALTISTTTIKGVPFQIQDLQNQINVLREQIVDLQGQINALTIVVNGIQSQVNTLETQVSSLDVRTGILEDEVATLKNQMKDLLDKNIFQVLADVFSGLAALAGLAAAASAAGLDIGSSVGWGIVAAGLAAAAFVFALLG